VITFYDFSKIENRDRWEYKKKDFHSIIFDGSIKDVTIKYDSLGNSEIKEGFLFLKQALESVNKHYKIWTESNK